MGSIGGWEIFWIVLLVLILFGAKRIPEMMRSMGQGMKEFKKAAREIGDETEPTPPATKSPTVSSPENRSKPV